jgi:hypothetical protein
MGEFQCSLFQPDFNRSIRVESRRERLSADGGALLLRELMDRLDYTALFRKHLRDPRDPARVTHAHEELLRTELLRLTQGWTAHSDLALLSEDPALRLAVSSRRGQRALRAGAGRDAQGLCSQPTLSRLLAALGREENRVGLGAMLLESAERRMNFKGRRLQITLDLDSLPVEVFGQQPGSAWNGHYRERCYHPLLVRSEHGDFLGAKLRAGNVHTAEGGGEFVLPILRRAAAWAERVWLRIDAGFPAPELLAALEAEGFRYVARLKTNAALERLALEPLRHSSGGEVPETHELLYQAGSWNEPRRVVLVIPTHRAEQEGLFPDHFFLLSNAPAEEISAQALLEHYRQRGEAEKDFGDWNQALDLALSSTPRTKTHYRGRVLHEDFTEPDSFAANEARLLLSLLAANLLHAGAALLERGSAKRMSRERFRQLVLKTAARVLLSGHRITIVIEAARAPLWSRFVRELNRLYPARGSPRPPALPTPA